MVIPLSRFPKYIFKVIFYSINRISNKSMFACIIFSYAVKKDSIGFTNKILPFISRSKYLFSKPIYYWFEFLNKNFLCFNIFFLCKLHQSFNILIIHKHHLFYYICNCCIYHIFGHF